MKLPTKKLEQELFGAGYTLLCAIDEVGMGCLAGPVVVCAVGVTEEFYKKDHLELCGIRDSKLLTTSQREKLATELIKLDDLTYAVSFAYPKTIDTLNIYQASRVAMRRVVKKILKQASLKSVILVDGNKKIPHLREEQKPVVKGDQNVFAIACASVIAKNYRDAMMKRYAKRYPGYGFEQHKGYSTKVHQKQLALLGVSPIHRRSFRLDY